MSYLLIFCTVSLLIILHELGHFLAAKRMGIPIARFSVGLGPKVWGFKIGETEYWLSMIPCGGYVLPALEDEEAFDKIPLKHHKDERHGQGHQQRACQEQPKIQLLPHACAAQCCQPQCEGPEIARGRT